MTETTTTVISPDLIERIRGCVNDGEWKGGAEYTYDEALDDLRNLLDVYDAQMRDLATRDASIENYSRRVTELKTERDDARDLAGVSPTVSCNCGWGGVHDPDNPRCDRNNTQERQ